MRSSPSLLVCSTDAWNERPSTLSRNKRSRRGYKKWGLCGILHQLSKLTTTGEGEKETGFFSIALAIPNRFLQSGPFIWVTSKYLGSCWYYRKTKVTLFDHSASTRPYFRSLMEKLLLNKVEGEKNRRSCESVFFLCVYQNRQRWLQNFLLISSPKDVKFLWYSWFQPKITITVQKLLSKSRFSIDCIVTMHGTVWLANHALFGCNF